MAWQVNGGAHVLVRVFVSIVHVFLSMFSISKYDSDVKYFESTAPVCYSSYQNTQTHTHARTQLTTTTTGNNSNSNSRASK